MAATAQSAEGDLVADKMSRLGAIADRANYRTAPLKGWITDESAGFGRDHLCHRRRCLPRVGTTHRFCRYRMEPYLTVAFGPVLRSVLQ
jgi:hypothetical protein